MPGDAWEGVAATILTLLGSVWSPEAPCCRPDVSAQEPWLARLRVVIWALIPCLSRVTVYGTRARPERAAAVAGGGCWPTCSPPRSSLRYSLGLRGFFFFLFSMAPLMAWMDGSAPPRCWA